MAATFAPRPSASLYVGSLSPDVAEATLFEIFNVVGPVASIRVCRDAVTRRSLGYAYVNFHNANDAERALDTLNYAVIKGRPCRLMWSQRDPSLRKSGFGNVFIKNLEKSIDNKSLHDTFSVFGNILSCRVMLDENGVSKGYGFVHFESAESAENAIAKTNGMEIQGKPVFVGHHKSRKERQPKIEEMKKNFTNIFVKNLDENITDEIFKQLFSQFGKITSAAIMHDDQGKSKGFGFVNYETHDEAASACDDMNEQEVSTTVNGDNIVINMGGKEITFKGAQKVSEKDAPAKGGETPVKKLFVGRAQKKSERKEELVRKYEALRNERLSKYQGVNLYIKNLDDTITDELLKKEFSSFGTITSAKIQTDERGHSRGFGFVCFSSPEEATKAIQECNGKMLVSKPIYVGLAQRKEVRRQQLEAQYAQRQMRNLSHGQMYGAPIFYPPVQRPYAYAPQMLPRRFPPGQGQGQQGQAGQEMMGGYRGPRQQRPPRAQGQQGQGQGQHMQQGQGMRMPPAAGSNPAMMQNRPQKGGVKYGPNVRNRPDATVVQQMNMPPPVSNTGNGYAPEQEQALTPSVLANMTQDEQKNLLGERLYHQVLDKAGSLSPKVTGMLLEMDNAELLHLLESPEHLNAKVDEALQVLASHGLMQD